VACHAGRGPALRLELAGGAGLAGGGDGAAGACVPCAVEGEVERLELAGRAERAELVEVPLGPWNALALLRARERRARRRAAVLCAGRALRHDAADREGVEGAVLDPVRARAARAGHAERAAEGFRSQVERQLVEAGRAHTGKDVHHTLLRVARVRRTRLARQREVPRHARVLPRARAAGRARRQAQLESDAACRTGLAGICVRGSHTCRELTGGTSVTDGGIGGLCKSAGGAGGALVDGATMQQDAAEAGVADARSLASRSGGAGGIGVAFQTRLARV